MLELKEVHTYYGESHVLHGITLAAPEGSVVALLGRLGAGKTTILHTIMGLVPPRGGEIRFRGEQITGLRPYLIAQKGLALVPQGRRIFPSLTVKENLVMAARSGGKKKPWSYDSVCALFPILAERARHKGNHLSGGEQQMLAIARALMTNPDFILMDEPSEGLAPIIVLELGSIIRRLNETGITVLLVEQNLQLALAAASYTYLINKGEIIHQCTSHELAGDHETQSKCLGVTR